MKWIILVAALLIAPLTWARAANADVAPSDVYDVPAVSVTQTGGAVPAWTADAFHVNLMASNPVLDGDFSRSALDGRFSLGWTPDGLLVHVAAHAPDPHESASTDTLWTGDSVELFLSAGWGSGQRYQLIVSPGVTSDQSIVREKLYDHRTASSPVGDIVTSHKTADGYTMDVVLPWSSLGIEAKNGVELGFNVYIDHVDANGARYQIAWREGTKASSDPHEVNRIRLAASSSVPVNEIVSAHYALFRRLVVGVESTDALTGRHLAARIDKGSTVPGIVDATDPHLAAFTFPMPSAGTSYGAASVTIDGHALRPFQLPDLAAAREDAFDWLPFVASPFVFTGASLPWLGYRSGNQAEDTIGRYTVDTTYYDAAYNVVKSAEKPGRYGAVSVVKSDMGFTKTYFTTVYRAKKDIEWRDPDLRLSFNLPASFGPDPATLADHPKVVRDGLRWSFLRAMYSGDDTAILLAGLDSLTTKDPDVERFDSHRIDENWWIGLKKKLAIPVDYNSIVHPPAGYDAKASKRWPLLVFLHGSGDGPVVPEKIAGNGIQDGASKDFVLVAPSCPPNSRWNPSLVIDVVDQAIAKYNIDTTRIYLTGLSMGGFGAYETAMAYPERFAALAPVCGMGDLEDIDRIKAMPTWIFHGEADTTVDPHPDHAMFEALTKIGAPVKATFYPGVGHDSWDATYHNPGVYEWLLQQHLPSAAP